MSAAHHTLAELEGLELEETPAPRRRVRDRIRSYIMTTPGGVDRHTHCAAVLSDDGNGVTSPGPDGHVHKVVGLEIRAVLGHGHDIAATRCSQEHDRKTGHHVEKRR